MLAGSQGQLTIIGLAQPRLAEGLQRDPA